MYNLLLYFALGISLICPLELAIAKNWIYGGETPFPWGKEITFPWHQIEGVWNSESPQSPRLRLDLLYKFEDEVRVINVTMYDGVGRIYARGMGVSGGAEKIFRAIMRNSSGKLFLVFVRAFTDLKDCSNGQIVVVVTERWLELTGNIQENHYMIYKPKDPSICSPLGQK